MNITLLLQLKPIGTSHFVHQLINAGTKKAAITVPVVMPLHHQAASYEVEKRIDTHKSYIYRYQEYHLPAIERPLDG